MNSTPPLEKDIFISYAHIDNEAPTEEEQGWVSAFDCALQTRLKQILGRDTSIWRDLKLQGNDIFNDEITDQFPKLKILVSIVTPRYLKSDWCLKELHEFSQIAEKSGGVRVGNKSRIFKIVKTPVSHKLYPTEIENVLGYDFFEVSDNTHFREFILEKGSPTFYKFIERLDDVAQDICQLINMLDEKIQPGNQSEGNSGSDDPEKNVYLATTTSDLRSEHDNIRRDLEKRGYCVYPDQQLPADDRFRDCIKDYLQKCKLSIHLIGNKYGLVPEDEQCSMVEIQFELSQSSPLNRLIWLPNPDPDSNDPRQLEFINSLQDQAVAQSSTDLLSGSLEDLKTVLIDTLVGLESPKATAEPCANPRIYLMYDESDRDEVITIDDYLYDQEFEVLKPIFEGDESDIRAIHQDNLRVCDGVLVFCNQATESWLYFKMNELRKAPGYRDGKPLKAGAIYLGGHSSHFKERFRSREAMVIKQFYAFSGEDLTAFLAQLKKSQGGAL